MGSFLSQQEIEELMSKLTPPEGSSVGNKTKQKTDPKEMQPASDSEKQPLEHEVKGVEFPELTPHKETKKQREPAFFGAVPVKLSLELGETILTVREILNLQKDSVIKLDRLAGENAVLSVNGRPLLLGEVVVINDNFGCRVSDFIQNGDTGSRKV